MYCRCFCKNRRIIWVQYNSHYRRIRRVRCSDWYVIMENALCLRSLSSCGRIRSGLRWFLRRMEWVKGFCQWYRSKLIVLVGYDKGVKLRILHVTSLKHLAPSRQVEHAKSYKSRIVHHLWTLFSNQGARWKCPDPPAYICILRLTCISGQRR